MKTSSYRFPDWEPEYDAVLQAKDIDDLKVKLTALEGVIFIRLQLLAGKKGHEVECDAIHFAIDTVLELQKTKLGYPSWVAHLKKPPMKVAS